MPTTTSKGLKIPLVGERGSVFYPALEHNIQKQNDHTHNGTDGEKINCKDLVKNTQTISSGDWTAVSGQSGTYRQLVVLPAGFTYDDAEMKFYISGGLENGALILPTVKRASSTSFYIDINDNTLDVKVVYG